MRHLMPLSLVFCSLLLLLHPCSAQLTPRQEKNLIAFARLYGYVHYFHPSDEAARLNWDQFAIYGAGRVLDAKDDAALISTLRQLFLPIAPTIQVYSEKQPAAFSPATVIPPDTAGYFPIAWQHKGWGMGNSKTYQSIRINRPLIKASAAFATIGQKFPANSFHGKEFRFSGWMKVDGSEGGSGHFWLRVDKAAGSSGYGFFYNMDDRPVTANVWKEYSFTGTIDSNAQSFIAGAFLSGKGRVWIDNIRIAVHEKDGWKEVPVKNAGFEKWTDDQQTVENWNYKSIPGYRFSRETKEAEEGSTALLITGLSEESGGEPASPLFPQYPRPGEYIQPVLTTGVSCIVPLALYGTKSHTWPAGDSLSLSRLHQNMTAAMPAILTGDSLSVRLADVIITWNIFRHFFAYWEDAAIKPDQLLQQTLAGAARAKTRQEFRRTLQQMTAALNDGHMHVNLQRDTALPWFPPLTLTHAENRVVIDRILDSTLPMLAPGDCITAIDGVPVEKVISDAELLISGSPQWKENSAFNEILSGPAGTSKQLTVLRSGSSSLVTIRRNLDYRKFYALLENTKPTEWIRPGIFYLNLDTYPQDSLQHRLQEMTTARAIICDLRGYPNGDPSLISHLLKQKETDKWLFMPQIIYPDYQKVDYWAGGWNMTPAEPHLDARIYFLTDKRAISYAESYMGYIKGLKLATIIGQPTAGTNGDINPISLPGGYYVTWSGLLVKNHDGSKHHLIGIVPDVRVDPTIKGIREGRDEFLEKALELAGQ